MMMLLNTLLLAYCGFFVIYLFFFAVASRIPKRTRRQSQRDRENTFAIFFPVYKDDTVIQESVKSFFSQRYPVHAFDVFVLSDGLLDSTQQQLRSYGAHIIPIDGGNRTKAKALNRALNVVDINQYDACVIFDADNIAEHMFLQKVNTALNSGWLAIQCHRVAKNLNTPIAYLDALSEEIANSTLRKGHRLLGLSSGLIGSGMVFRLPLFKDVMAEIFATNGFDKDLEFALFKRGVEIEYLDDVLVYDEKVQSASVLQQQRTRWFAAQWKNIRKGFRSLRAHATIDGFNKWLQMIMLPRVFLLLLVTVSAMAAGFSGDPVNGLRWLGLDCVLVAALLIAIPNKLYRAELIQAILSFPRAVNALVLAVMNIQSANKGFLHTPHSTASIPLSTGE